MGQETMSNREKKARRNNKKKKVIKVIKEAKKAAFNESLVIAIKCYDSAGFSSYNYNNFFIRTLSSRA